ncbi:YhfC family glutamic-type intramembrane protease [Niallia sp. NCCP-28]|uniref:YhfC family glutamic-type intramembrane protease n=1 Tax=Niallia sp. NCCP-28 TaxID=2934712 RepID=UPI0035CF1DEF
MQYKLNLLMRIFALTLYIAFSLAVLYVVKQNYSKCVLYAILFHAAVNFMPALYQQA